MMIFGENLASIAYISGSGFTMDEQESSIICGGVMSNRLYAWDVKTGNMIWASQVQEYYIINMITVPQMHLIFTSDLHNNVKMWNCYNTEPLAAANLSLRCCCIEVFIINRCPFLVIGGSDGHIYTLTMPNLRCISRIFVFKYQIDHLLCSPDKKYIFAIGYFMLTPHHIGSYDGNMIVFENHPHLLLYTIDGNMIHDFCNHDRDITCLSMVGF
ncbi:PREDICTED: F-box/WD repeat-containing protein 12-like [Elephantulus edwardii]|uniref:F-box/WD repeat-containing protein 12-like n=1 Tax=Elephantulus edwardii TaxID=28737 RepID=UPI0003F06446|nr:PREDICTED: F-box/WD repeat-containing protein 12-like [Elephantulus edwardii]